MNSDIQLTYTSSIILQAIHHGYRYGFEIMEMAGLPSGTVYPALRRLERAGLIQSDWEADDPSGAAGGPPRKYYSITRDGQEMLTRVTERYHLLAQWKPPDPKTPSSRKKVKVPRR